MRTVAMALFLVPAAARLWDGDVISSTRDVNVFRFAVSGGSAELEWISPSSFRYARYWDRNGEAREPINPERVDVGFLDAGAVCRFTTKHLTVELEKTGLRLRASGREGVLLADAAEIRRAGRNIVIERLAAPAERFYGLGLRTTPEANLRRQSIQAGKPFLISSAGYAESFSSPGLYTYDLGRTRPDRRVVTIEGEDHVEYTFHYGPTPKEALEEHMAVSGAVADLEAKDFRLLRAGSGPEEGIMLPPSGPGTWATLRGSVYSLAHAAMSGYVLPAFDLSRYFSAPDVLFARAAQLGSVMPLLYSARPPRQKARVLRDAVRFRKQLTPFLVSYAWEARDLGYPLIRPLAMQFPKDLEAERQTDAFMLGEELLIAPIVNPEARRTVYLPMGIWTDFRTNRVHQGRQRIDVAGDHLAVFVRNGSLLPLAATSEDGPMELHYFPKLGGEFFLFEEDLDEISQFHASPAGDLFRLEIESQKDRVYEWVVHHSGPTVRVAAGEEEYAEADSAAALKPGAWFYDRASGQTRVRCRATAGRHLVIAVE
jgi:alpha-glucosidase (family GH31 glycosyl hydrolase)